MKFYPMTQAAMEDLLYSMGNFKQESFFKRQELLSHVESFEESIIRNTFSKPVDTIISSNHGSKDKIYKIYTKSREDFDKQMDDVSDELLKIYEKEDLIRFVKKCMRRMPLFQEMALTELYIEGMRLDEYCKRHYMSRPEASRLQRNALKNLLVIYNDTI